MKYSTSTEKSLDLDSTSITTKIEEAIVDDWDKPFTHQDLEAIDVAFQAAHAHAQLTTSLSSSSSKTPRFESTDDPPRTRRRLATSNGETGSGQRSGSFAPVSCPSNRPFPFPQAQANMEMQYPAMHFQGRIVYSRTVAEVNKATLQILKLLEAKKKGTGRCVLGIDIEWKPSFRRGIPQGKAAVMQICGDMSHCFVLHIIHSGIPQCLRSLLEDSTFIKVGVGIDNDAVKVFRDHNVSIRSLEDLSSLANEKLGGAQKHWSLSSLVETLTCKKLLKPKKIRLGNWEKKCLSEEQLQYAATDAFASWYLYEVLKSFPVLSEKQV